MAETSNKIAPTTVRVRFARTARARTPSQVTALDVDGQMLRVVQAGAGGRILRMATASLDLAPDADRSDAAVMGAAMARALKAIDLSPSLVVMGVPRARVVLRYLRLPAGAAGGELAALVHFQAAKDLPFRMDEAVIDFQVCGTVTAAPVPASAEKSGEAAAGTPAPDPAAPQVEVLVAAVKASEVDFHHALAKAAGFKLAGLGLIPVANARCVEVTQPENDPHAFVLVTLRTDELGIDIVAGRSLRFSRGSVLRAGADAPASPVAAVVIEVVRSLHAYAGQGSPPTVERLLVAGCTGQEAELVTALCARFDFPCELFNPANAFQLPAEVAPNVAGGSLGALGLASAITASGLPIDFLKPKRPPVQRDYRRIKILAGIVAATILGFGIFGVRTLLVRNRTTVLNSATAELTDAEKKRPTYRRLVQQATVVDDWVKGGRDWLDHVAYLTSILPPAEEIYVTSLTIDGQSGIHLAVQARSGETLARLEKQLRAAGYDIRPIAISPGADRFGYEFRSTVDLTVPERLRIDLQKVKPPPRPLDDMSLEPAAYRRSGG